MYVNFGQQTSTNGSRLLGSYLLWRDLQPRETVVHHVNHDPRDNRPVNLAVMSRHVHNWHHEPKTQVINICERCGVLFVIKSRLGKRHQRTCSRSCGRHLLQQFARAGRDWKGNPRTPRRQGP